MTEIKSNVNNTNNRDYNKSTNPTEKLLQTAPGVNITPVGALYNIRGSEVEEFVSYYLTTGDVKIQGIKYVALFADETYQKPPKMMLLLDRNYYIKKDKNPQVRIAPAIAKKLDNFKPYVNISMDPMVQKKIASISILEQNPADRSKYIFKTTISKQNQNVIGIELDIFRVLRCMLDARSNEFEIRMPSAYTIAKGQEVILDVIKIKRIPSSYNKGNNNGSVNYNAIARECIRN